MRIAELLRRPSFRGLLFFIAAGAILGYILWCPIQCWRIRQLLKVRRLSDAAELAQKLTTRHPTCAECQFLNAKAARRHGEIQRSQEAIDRAESLGWTASEIHRERMLTQIQIGRVSDLPQQIGLLSAGELSPAETEELYEAVAFGYLAAFNVPEFQRCLDFWLEFNPRAIQPLKMRAEYLERIGKYFEAAKIYEQIVQIDTTNLDGHLGWGRCLVELNQPAKAEDHLRHCQEASPSPVTAVLLARCLTQNGKALEAGDLLKRYRDTSDTASRAIVLEELGRWASQQQDIELAVTSLQESVQLAPESATAWHSLSMAYGMAGEKEKRRDALKKSQEIRVRVQRFSEIMTELSRNPTDIPLRIEAAEILFQQGFDQDAVAWLMTALQQDLHHPKANQMLAEYYDRKGQKEQANNHRQLGGLAP